uniref:DUF148 domain-containing protein n=1 Tax=Strongyloides papillosus TaxID=174720 RepID=A0A0N5CAE7_STREA
MYFTKYFAIFVILAVQYSFQDSSSSESLSSSSEERQLVDGSLNEMSLPDANVEKQKKGILGKIRSGIKEKTKSAKYILKKQLGKENLKNKFNEVKEKLDNSLKKDKKKIEKTFKNLKERVSGLLRKKLSAKSDLNENETRLKRSFLGKAGKGAKRLLDKGASNTRALLEKLF